MFDTTFNPSLPLPLRLGDVNMDGFPDVLLVVSTSSGTQVRVLESVACGPQYKECRSGRTFRVPPRGTAALDAITDVKLASFIDVDDDVSLHASSLRLIRQQKLNLALCPAGLVGHLGAAHRKAVQGAGHCRPERLLQRRLLPQGSGCVHCV